MGKNNISPDNRSPRDLLGDLLAAIGMADANPYLTWPLEMALGEIESAWLARREVPNVGPYRKELRRFRAITAKRRELRKQFGPVVREGTSSRSSAPEAAAAQPYDASALRLAGHRTGAAPN